MDEAVEIAITGLREEVGQVRHDISVIRDDHQAHAVKDDLVMGEIKERLAAWSGQLDLIKWMVAAILAAILAYGARHW